MNKKEAKQEWYKTLKAIESLLKFNGTQQAKYFATVLLYEMVFAKHDLFSQEFKDIIKGN